jgi:hypothetical protein
MVIYGDNANKLISIIEDTLDIKATMTLKYDDQFMYRFSTTEVYLVQYNKGNSFNVHYEGLQLVLRQDEVDEKEDEIIRELRKHKMENVLKRG